MWRNELGGSERLDEMGSRVAKGMGLFCCDSRDVEPAVQTEENDGGLDIPPNLAQKRHS